METIEQILRLKAELCIKRDSLANLYNEYIEILVKNEKNIEVYDEYVRKITDLEVPTKQTKEQMREYNRKLKALGYSGD